MRCVHLQPCGNLAYHYASLGACIADGRFLGQPLGQRGHGPARGLVCRPGSRVSQRSALSGGGTHVGLTSPLWHRLKEAEDSALVSDEKPLTCFLGKVFHYWVGRNAYYGVWSATHPGDSSYSLDREELHNRIEAQRVQGSTFTMAELPALVLLGQRLSLVLFQHQAAPPFRDVPPSAVSGGLLLDVAHSVANHTGDTSVFVASPDLLKLAALPYRTWSSFRQGGGYALGWSPWDDCCDIEPILRVCAAICAHLNSRH